MPVLMKGHVWLERKDKIKRDKTPVVVYPLFAEIKYDEIRCHVRVRTEVLADEDRIEFLSYAGKPLANMERFVPKFMRLHNITHQVEFDCGFLVNSSFNDSYRWVRSTNGLPEDLAGAHVEFILFDLPQCELPYIQRIGVIDAVARYGELQVPMRYRCYTEEDVLRYFDEVTAAGFEGLMLKSATHVYEKGKRTDSWLKFKPSNDEAGVVVAVTEAVCGKDQPDLGLCKGDKLGRAASVTVRMPDGSTASPGGLQHELARLVWMYPESFIGLTVEFKYMERDRQGGYRHPVFYRFREETV